MRPGVHFPQHVDSAHYLDRRGQNFDISTLHRLQQPERLHRIPTSSKPVGVAWNVPAIQQFGAPVNVNAMQRIPSNASAGPSSKWRRYDA